MGFFLRSKVIFPLRVVGGIASSGRLPILGALGSALFFALLFACTNLEWAELEKRIDENLNGTLTHPGNLDPAGVNNFSFIVVGDTHVGHPAGQIFADQVSSLLQGGDAFVVVAGDVTQAGLDTEYEAFKGLLSALNISYRAAIGNHDIYFGGWDRWKRHLGRSIYSFDADNVHFVMLDSGNGLLGEGQLEWLRQDLAQTTQPHKIVVSHYPPWIGRFSSIFKMSSEEEAAVLKDILNSYGVELMFSGHYHGYDEVVLNSTRYIVTGGMNNLIDFGNQKNYVRVFVEGSSIRTEAVSF